MGEIYFSKRWEWRQGGRIPAPFDQNTDDPVFFIGGSGEDLSETGIHLSGMKSKMAEREGRGGKERSGVRPRFLEKRALSIAFEGFFPRPVAVGREDVRISRVPPEFEVKAAFESADAGGGA